MGALTALQWPLTFYQGGLLGLQRQVLLNGITIATATLSGGGALLVLWLVSPTVSAFFTWQIAVSLLQAAATTFALWRCLPGSGHVARFDPGITRDIWRFAAGMSGITITALLLTQLDKVILSKMLTLKTFGYYILAGVVGNGLSVVLITPMFNTVFPRFSSLVAAADEKSLLAMYHGSTQVMAVMILPAAAVIAFFSPEIMLLWTGSPEIADNTASIVSILVAGTALNGLMNLPYALQLSHGWTRIGLAINAMFIIAIVPAIVFMTTHYGAAGAASVWLGLNAVYMIVGVPLTHRRLLKGEAFRWFTKDVGIPMAGSLIIAGIARLIFPVFDSPSRFVSASLLLLIFSFTFSAPPCAPRRRGISYRNPSSAGNSPWSAVYEIIRRFPTTKFCENSPLHGNPEMISVLKSLSEIKSARGEMRRSGISCLTPWFRRRLQGLGAVDGIPVGDAIKSWDVLKTAIFIKDHLPLGTPVLDVGAYASEILSVLHRLNYSNLTGVDLNPGIKEMPFADHIRYDMADFMATPFPDASFGAITAISVIEHGFRSERLLREISRLLRPGGYFIASFDYWPEKVETTGMDIFGMDWRIFSKAEVLAFIEEARAYGLSPCGEIDLEGGEKVIRWGGKEYTFALLALGKK